MIEVAAATLLRDRTLTLRIYAQAWIPEYWIVNSQDNQIEVYSDPGGEGNSATYQQRVVYTTTIPVIIDGQQIAQINANALLP